MDKCQPLTLTFKLDLSNPLSEARWLRSRERNAWSTLPSLGLSATDEQDIEKACAWYNKIQVMDPDCVSRKVSFFNLKFIVPFFFSFFYQSPTLNDIAQKLDVTAFAI